MSSAKNESLHLPLVGGRVEAGFPSPADDFIERSLDLNEQLVHNPIATFFICARGHSMVGAGIHDGDLLVVDRSMTPTHGSIVVAVVDGGLTVKRLSITRGSSQLHPEPNQQSQETFQSIPLHEECDVTIWGVVTWSLHRLGMPCTH